MGPGVKKIAWWRHGLKMCLRYMLRGRLAVHLWRERWTPQVVPEGRSARPLFRVRFPGAAFTSGDVVFIEKKRETAMRLAGRAIENARRINGSGGFQCPRLGDALAPRMGGSSPPRSRSACGFVVRPLRCMVRVWQGLFLKMLCQ